MLHFNDFALEIVPKRPICKAQKHFSEEFSSVEHVGISIFFLACGRLRILSKLKKRVRDLFIEWEQNPPEGRNFFEG